MSIDAMKQALEALEAGDFYIGQLELLVYTADDTGTHKDRAKVQAAITALRAAIEQAQEPVAWVYPEALEAFKNGRPWTAYGSNGDGRIPLYLNDAVARKWQGLTDEEREQFRQWAHPDIIEAIELRLQERNT